MFEGPAEGVLRDVRADALKVRLVANDMIVETPLPDRFSGSAAEVVDPFARDRLDLADYGAE